MWPFWWHVSILGTRVYKQVGQKSQHDRQSLLCLNFWSGTHKLLNTRVMSAGRSVSAYLDQEVACRKFLMTTHCPFTRATTHSCSRSCSNLEVLCRHWCTATMQMQMNVECRDLGIFWSCRLPWGNCVSLGRSLECQGCWHAAWFTLGCRPWMRFGLLDVL